MLTKWMKVITRLILENEIPTELPIPNIIAVPICKYINNEHHWKMYKSNNKEDNGEESNEKPRRRSHFVHPNILVPIPKELRMYSDAL